MLEKDGTKCTYCRACAEYMVAGDEEGAVASCPNGALKIKDNENSSLKGEK